VKMSLKERWSESLSRIQSSVADELQSIGKRIEQMLVSDFEPIDEVLGHLFSTSGKLIRPTLLLLTADRKRTRLDDLIGLGASIEIVHTASLVHDDSIDSSPYRRGVETLNSKWNHKTSVIIGDYLLAQAFNEIARLRNTEIVAEMTAACQKLAAGEMRQMSMEGDLGVTEEDYFAFIREKTASLFAATCSVAAILSSGACREEFKRFGMLFGCIFQITDDLLDYIGSSPETGKPTGLDIRDRKMTLPLIHALTRMDRAALGELQEAFSRQGRMSREQADRLIELVIEAGGIDYAWSRVIELGAEARGVLDGLPTERSEKLRELVDIIVERDR
jgi:octaprenyl-diphosphate synthase